MPFEQTIYHLPRTRRKPVSEPHFATMLQPFTWKPKCGKPFVVVHQPQTRPFDAPDSHRFFEVTPNREIYTSNEAVEVVGMQLIKECMTRLNALAKLHDGIFYSQQFRAYGAGFVLWITDEGMYRPIRVGYDRRCEQPVPEISPLVQHWIDLSRKYSGEPGQARVLDIVKYLREYYFVDDRLLELRNVENIMDTRRFNSHDELMHFCRTMCIQIL